MDPSEVEFLAEKEMVTIIPNFSHDEVFLIGGNVGPFNPSLPMQVPLWMAINLQQSPILVQAYQTIHRLSKQGIELTS